MRGEVLRMRIASSSGRRLLLAAAAALPAAALAASLTSAQAAPSARAAAPRLLTQACGGTSWVAGSTNVCDGSVVYRDYVYDDEGADTGDIGYNGTQNAFGTLAHPAGDKRYPAGDINTADLVNLRLTRSGNSVVVTAELNALLHSGSTILALAVDTDGNPATGGGAWNDLGVSSTGWDKIYTFTTGDTASNLITGSFPLPAAATWRVQAVTAQAVSKTVMNVAFRGVDEHAAYKLSYNNPSTRPPSGQGAWFEDDQAAALTSGNISGFGYTVSTADLAPGVERLQQVGPGLHERVYTSSATLPPGEGMSYDGIKGRGNGGSATAFAQVFNFLGKYQPYGIYLPDTAGPHGMQMEWHGSNQGIVAQINQPGMQKQFGDDLDRILVVPEARGPNGYGSDISERDLLDVMADVQAHYPVDAGRVFSSGYSQGGYIGFRMAMLFPDRFAGFTTWVGFTGDDLNGVPVQGTAAVRAGAVGNMIDYVRNLRHLPGSMIYAGADELVQVPSSTAMEQAFAGTDDVYTWYLHPTAEHLTFAAVDDWQKEANDSKDQHLVVDPARVTFRTATELDAPSFGIRHDRAYWVSEIRGPDNAFLDTDLTSHGCGVSVPTTTTGMGAGPQPVPWTSRFRAATGSRLLPAEQLLEGTLSNVTSLRIDLPRACLGGDFAYRVTSAQPAVLTLSDGRTIPLVAGVNAGRISASGLVTKTAVPKQKPARTGTKAAGRRPTRVSAAAPKQPTRTLAFTGLGVGLPVAGASLLSGAVLLRRRRRVNPA